MPALPDLDALPVLPTDAEGPVFKEPWEAQAFAMTVKLYEGGHFTWKEWADYLAAEIAAARDRGEPDTGETYYTYWLSALEKIATDKGLTTQTDLSQRKDAWDRAAKATPHGEPILLDRIARGADGG